MLRLSFFAILLISFAYKSICRGQELNPANQIDLEKSVAIKHVIDNAAFFQITPRGMKLFQNNIYTLLQTQGSFQFEENLFAPDRLAMDPLTTEKLLKNDPEKLKLVQTLRNFIGLWTQGFTLVSPHRFVLEIGNSGYQTKFTKFALNADQALLEALKKDNGAVLTLEIEAEKAILFADRARVEDLANPFFQKFGGDQISISIKNTKQSLKTSVQAPKIFLKIPFYVSLNSDATLHFEVLPRIENNIQEAEIDFKFKKLVTGQFQIISRDENGKNEKIIDVDTRSFSTLLADNKAMLIEQLKGHVNHFIQFELPEFINAQARDIFKNKIAFYDTLSPASKGVEDSRPDFVMGHFVRRPSDFRQLNGLNFWISSLIEDPLNPKSEPNPFHRAQKPPSLNLLPTSEVDGILVIDQGIINRYLQLSYERGSFEKVESLSCVDNSKSFLKLTQAPVFAALPGRNSNQPQEAFAKLILGTEIDAPESQKIAFTKNGQGVEKVRFSMEVAVQLRVMKDRNCEVPLSEVVCVYPESGKGPCRTITRVKKVVDPNLSCLEIIKLETLPNNVKLDRSCLSFLGKLAEGFNSKVTRGITETLNSMDEKCTKIGKKTILAENVVMPPVLFGIKFDVAKFKVDENGQLVMYLNYKPGTRIAQKEKTLSASSLSPSRNLSKSPNSNSNLGSPQL